VGETVSKKTMLILTGATAVAVISAMFVMGSFRSEFDKRLEEVSKIRFIFPAGETIESYTDWAEIECIQKNLDISSGAVYTGDTFTRWTYMEWWCWSWSQFEETLFDALASGEFVGHYIYYDKASKTMWFDTLTSRTIPEMAQSNVIYDWTTHYITIE